MKKYRNVFLDTDIKKESFIDFGDKGADDEAEVNADAEGEDVTVEEAPEQTAEMTAAETDEIVEVIEE